MAVETAADLAALFAADEFATEATWTVGATPSTVAGIFKDPHGEVGVLDDLAISSTVPEFVCPKTSVPAGAGQGDQLVVNGTTYRITDLRPSGDGLTRAALEEA